MANNYGTFSYPGNVASNPSVGPNASTIPADSTLVGGENPSGNLKPLQTDNSGNLLVSLAAEPLTPFNTKDAADGSPGSAAPATAIQMGGTDGTDLRAISTDSSGNLRNLPSSFDTTLTMTSSGQTQNYTIEGYGNLNAQAQGSYTGWVAFYGSNDNTNWYNIYFYDLINQGAQNLLSTGDVASLPLMGFKYLQIKTISFSGTANLSLTFTASPGPQLAFSPLPAGFKTQAWMFDSAGTGVTVGQKAMAASVPVAIASDQASIPVAATLQAGSAIVGKVAIDQTTPGTTNGVQINAALPSGSNVIGHVINDAGSAIIGKVGIDQTTPGTTNGVQINAALPAGTNLIGKTGIDQTTPGTTNAVSVAQIGANSVLTGNGTTGTGSMRVTIASDNTAFSVNAAVTPTKGTLTDNSGTTSGTPSTSTTLMTSNASRKYLLIQNVSLSNTIWINFTSAATTTQPSIQLLPGAAFSQEEGFISTEAITVISTAASSPYTAKQA